MKTYIKSLLLLLITCAFLNIVYSQDNKTTKQASKAAIIKNLVDSQNFVFVPNTVTPMRGSLRQLTSLYDIMVSKDSVLSYLPYFGRAYTAPYNPDEAGLKFTSTKFSYAKTPHKRKGWNILIMPKDNAEVQQLSFTIFENGSASLQVLSANRDPISFQGYIRERKQKKT